MTQYGAPSPVRVGPNAAVAAFRGLSDHEILPVCVSALLGHGEEWFGHELFDEPPTRLINRRPDLLPREALVEGFRSWAERVLGETEPALAEAYLEAAYAESARCGCHAALIALDGKSARHPSPNLRSQAVTSSSA